MNKRSKNQKIRFFILALISIVVSPLYSQSLERVDIDENISIKMPHDYKTIKTGDSLTIVAFMQSGKLSIERFTLSEQLTNNHENKELDGLKYFVDGYIKGMDFGEEVSLFENTTVLLDKLEGRRIRYSLGNKGELCEVYFLITGRVMYEVKYCEDSEMPAEKSKAILSSIRHR